MITGVAFAFAAAVGALLRAEVGRRWNHHGRFAIGTLVVNVSGSFLLGLLWNVAPPALTVLGVGGLGAFTTFSSFARDAVALTEFGKWRLAAFYIIASCALGIGAAALGVAIAG